MVSTIPANGAAAACTDTPLTITFDREPQLGKAGVIRVHRADGTVVDAIDVADPASARRAIGGAGQGGREHAWAYRPARVEGRSVTFVLHRALDYGQAYHVTMTPGLVEFEGSQPFAGVEGPEGWRFSTRAGPPAAGADRLVVAQDGSGDFRTVQGAIDFVPRGNSRRVFVVVRPGTYDEIVYVRADRPFITVVGADRERTVIRGTNNERLNPGHFRGLFSVDADDFVLSRITLHNTTPRRGSQAEAFRGVGRRVLLDGVTLRSFQDTLRIQGRALVRGCRVEGDVDFLWGSGGVVFQDSELMMLSPRGYYVQVRNPEGGVGFVFLDCRLTRGGEDVVGGYLARVDPNVYPFSQVVLIRTAIGPHVRPEGWLLNNAAEAPRARFWEYRSTDLGGRPLDVAGRAPFSRQLSDEEARRWSDPAAALGGWSPDPASITPPAAGPR